MQIVFELALSFEWHGHAATNEWAIHKDDNTYAISFLYQGKWYSYFAWHKSLNAFASFLSRVAIGPMTATEFDTMDKDRLTQWDKCPVMLNTEEKQYLILKMAGKDPMAMDLLDDVLAKG